MHPLTQADSTTYGPAELKGLIGLFDEVWASLSADGLANVDGLKRQRDRLAVIILDLARDKQLGPLEIARTAARLMRQE